MINYKTVEELVSSKLDAGGGSFRFQLLEVRNERDINRLSVTGGVKLAETLTYRLHPFRDCSWQSKEVIWWMIKRNSAIKRWRKEKFSGSIK